MTPTAAPLDAASMNSLYGDGGGDGGGARIGGMTDVRGVGPRP
ncbi:hypothetical protein [Streptomyces aureocirculatus]|nr:hypothetical protein [Streptomyces aureocirculatus]